jgi:hypothetical protein
MRARGPQVRLFIQVAILAATVVAMAPAQSSAKTARPARHHPRHHLVRHATRQPFRLRLPTADDFSGARAANRDVAVASSASVYDRPRMTIDYRLAGRGPVGSVGLLHPSDTQRAPAYVGPAASLRRGYPEVDAGAKLSYPF